MDTEDSQFLGTGWSWPPEFSAEKVAVNMTSGREDVDKSLEILLSTTIGERMMHPGFGCNTEKLLFEPLTTTLKSSMERMVRDAILFYEPRIILNGLELDHDDENGVINFHLEYTITGTNTRINLVYPFYLEEGTNL